MKTLTPDLIWELRHLGYRKIAVEVGASRKQVASQAHRWGFIRKPHSHRMLMAPCRHCTSSFHVQEGTEERVCPRCAQSDVNVVEWWRRDFEEARAARPWAQRRRVA